VNETGYIKASQVQGSSFNVGDKVVYQGKEMIVSKAKDRDGDLKMTNLPDWSGLNALADAFRVNGALTSLDISNNRMGDDGVKLICEALKQNSSLKVLDLNASYTRGGEIGPQGAQYLADMLSVNGGLTSIKMSGNDLTDSGGDMTGIKELAAALGVNGALTQVLAF
jgi:Ran GTPase-activating protein (RanGAP) involved in mRNA processing and transport